MITKFKLYEKSELIVDVDLSTINVIIKDQYNYFQIIITDKKIAEGNFSESEIRYSFKIMNNELYFHGEPGITYDLSENDKYHKYNYNDFYKNHKEKVKLIYDELCKINISEIINIQHYEAYTLLYDFIAQISDIKFLIKLKNFDI